MKAMWTAAWTRVVIAVAATACSKASTGVDIGEIERLSISLERSMGEPSGYYLGVSFAVRPPAADVVVRAACQVGDRRYVDIGLAELDAKRRPTGMSPSVPFIGTTLATQPSLCELTFFDEATPADPLAVACVTIGKPPVAGPCPANPSEGAGTAGGFSIPSLRVRTHPTHKRLYVDYVVQAHRDQDAKSSVAIEIQCKDGSGDQDARPEPGMLRAGESFRAFYSTELTDPSTACSVILRTNGETIRASCATGDALAPGACP